MSRLMASFPVLSSGNDAEEIIPVDSIVRICSATESTTRVYYATGIRENEKNPMSPLKIDYLVCSLPIAVVRKCLAKAMNIISVSQG